MYEELAKRLKIAAQWADKGLLIPPSLCLKAADAIEQLSNAGSAYGRGWTLGYDAGREESKPRWIPAAERLPEERINPNTRDFEYVLCTTIWGDVRPFKYGTQIGQRVAHFWNGAGYVDAYVTNWMQLPDPPKEDE